MDKIDEISLDPIAIGHQMHEISPMGVGASPNSAVIVGDLTVSEIDVERGVYALAH